MPLIITSIEQAILELQAGKPVAIPTETVYGLAAMINKPTAIKEVFAMKNRPLSHPLIVHVGDGWDLGEYVEEIPDYAQKLIDLFWPGPLTLVLKAKKDQINPLVTGGQATVAIRCPAHNIAQKVLNKTGVPLVAPSANPFGKISPTTAQHVKQSFPDKNSLLILDGGRCSVGIESTIIDATHYGSYQVLRHGLINEHTINKVISTSAVENENDLRVPGKLASHYQPQKTLYYFDDLNMLDDFCQKRAGDVFVIAQEKPASVSSQLFYRLDERPSRAAYDLYYNLRRADASSAMCIAIELPPATIEWQGVRERILKAGFPYAKYIAK
ncbi:L-threonylcarbamoyladenylate synthase [Legionella sp. km772]|uniref:L-threonylcarbamoyladenylate synthase n=1 Tax=Legionella sp. km772 TaxID=2498111 RepID=UPI000F8F3F2F|nr:L-threonylcarbamoyladenylate synthase [Legionella sp. km772]RUR11674.1 threonylcarbamoyl-AMP synthase [Legionella sp. km772]